VELQSRATEAQSALGDRDKARELIAEAFKRDPTDPRLLYEYDLMRGLYDEDTHPGSRCCGSAEVSSFSATT
jgi:hypothetical protein